MSERFIRKATKGRRIRNGQLRRDFARLLEIITDGREPDFEEHEALANKYRFYFGAKGAVKQHPGEKRSNRDKKQPPEEKRSNREKVIRDFIDRHDKVIKRLAEDE